MKTAMLWGAGGGIGCALETKLAAEEWRVLSFLAPKAHLIFVGAVTERITLPRLAPYAAAKAGLEALAAVLAKEERRRRVSVVRPAAVATSFWDKVPFRLPPNAVKPGEIAEQVLDIYHAGRQGVIDL